MNTQNKLVLGLFSLAFISLGGLQAATQYLNYNQSSVLGDQTSYFAQVGGKANFNVCSTNSDCASTYCHPILKRCLPYSASASIQAPIPTKPDLSPLPTVQLPSRALLPPMPTIVQLSPNIPCSAAQDLYSRYCSRMYPTDGSQIFAPNYISCDQYQAFLTKSCQLAKITLPPTPTLSPITKCGINSFYVSECADQKGYNQVSGNCYDGYQYSYQSQFCTSYEELRNYATKICANHCSAETTPTLPPTKVPSPAPTSIISTSCRLTKYYLTDLCPTTSSEEVMARGAKYACSNGYEASYNSTECQSQGVIYKSIMTLCSQQTCSKNITP